MSRLDFVPKAKEQQVNLEKGTLSFVPLPGKKVDACRLARRIEDAGYKVPSIKIVVQGRLTQYNGSPALEVPETGQFFLLQDTEAMRRAQEELKPAGLVRVTGSLDYNCQGRPSIRVKSYSGI